MNAPKASYPQDEVEFLEEDAVALEPLEEVVVVALSSSVFTLSSDFEDEVVVGTVLVVEVENFAVVEISVSDSLSLVVVDAARAITGRPRRRNFWNNILLESFVCWLKERMKLKNIGIR